MKKIIICLMFGIFLLSLASAIECGDNFIGTFKVNEAVQLRQTCDDCTYVNLSSVTYPNSTTIHFNEFMEKNGIEFNYTFSALVITGDYFYVVSGDKSGGFASETFCFDVTPSGKLGVLIFLAVFAFAFVGLGIGLKIPSLGFIGSILLILAGMYTMIYGLCDVANLYTRGIAISLLGLGFIFMISSAYEWFSFGEMEG